MDFITQYTLANSGTMVPPRHIRWSAIFVLAATMGRRIFVDHEHYKLYPNLYITLVGDQGIRKGTAKDAAHDLFTSVFPNHPIGNSRMSAEEIVRYMSGEEADCIRGYEDEKGEMQEVRPLTFFINELKNFMTWNPQGMVEFLTDVYDRLGRSYSSAGLKRGKEVIPFPCINILACETPDWIIDKLKLQITAGGFSRRMLYVYETEEQKRIAFPVKSPAAYLAEEWCKAHLLKISTVVGPVQWEKPAMTYLAQWFENLPKQTNTVLKGFYEAKDGLATKIAMLLCVAEEEPKLCISLPIMEKAVIFLESLEDTLHLLTLAVGRNELLVPQSRLLQKLANNGGWMIEHLFHKIASFDMNEIEYSSTKKMLKDTKQIYEIYLGEGGERHAIVALPEKIDELKEKNG